MKNDSLAISIASGKGGTGKTTLAVNLAAVAGEVTLLDCDVEEPNDHLFLDVEWGESRESCVPFPRVDTNLCTGCGECRRVCRFNAVVVLGKQPLIYPELCHGCGACFIACPEKAITEVDRAVGIVERGTFREIELVHGRLNIGEVKGPPLIEAVKDAAAHNGRAAIIDAPPGAGCPAVEAVRNTDYCVLVTEPTPFGIHDLEVAVEMARQLGVKHGVVINRSDIGDDRAVRFCEERGITLLGQIPFDREAAEAYSRGELLVDALPKYRETFGELWQSIIKEARGA
ncbi:MAG: (4Fe-4S)-binding protein [Planctomycetota bacterium]|nr:MAG: (4Fe-4S)-binding protein [Planctomycetota bacterium]